MCVSPECHEEYYALPEKNEALRTFHSAEKRYDEKRCVHAFSGARRLHGKDFWRDAKLSAGERNDCRNYNAMVAVWMRFPLDIKFIELLVKWQPPLYEDFDVTK